MNVDRAGRPSFSAPTTCSPRAMSAFPFTSSSIDRSLVPAARPAAGAVVNRTLTTQPSIVNSVSKYSYVSYPILPDDLLAKWQIRQPGAATRRATSPAPSATDPEMAGRPEPKRANSVAGNGPGMQRQRHRQSAGRSAQFVAACIERRGNAGIRRAQQRQPFLHGAHARGREVLTRSGRVAEPGVVGDVHQPGRPVAAIDDLRRKRSLRSRSAAPNGGSPGTCNVRGPGPEAKPLPGITMIGSGSQSGIYSPKGTRCHLS